ncbi:MAG: hypothetical protein J6S00_06445 [Clostridia bacterium]|nr:hypothetical protein [Clostridia bacterium]
MLFTAVLICVVVAVIIGIVVPKKAVYNKLDKAGFILNIVLSVIYVPMSFIGVFSLFAADSMSMYSDTIQMIIEIMIYIGITLPFMSVIDIVLSVILRKRGKRILSFVIQFIPLILFIIMVVTLALIGIKL